MIISRETNIFLIRAVRDKRAGKINAHAQWHSEDTQREESAKKGEVFAVPLAGTLIYLTLLPLAEIRD